MDHVGVLLLNYRSYADTVRYVANLQQQLGVRLSILIVDNCSPDGDYERLQNLFAADPMVEVLRSNRNGGYAYGNNIGLRHWRSFPLDYLLVSNTDIRIDDNHLVRKMAALYPTLDRPGFLAPRMLVDGHEDTKHQAWKLPGFRDELLLSLRGLYALGKCFGWTNTYRFPETDREVHPVDCLSGSFFLGSKALFDRLGPLDENTFLYMEENILAYRMRDLGLQNYFMRGGYFHHEHGATTRRVRRLAELQRIRRASTDYYLKHYVSAPNWQRYLLQWTYYPWLLETLLLRWVTGKTLT